jgi:hypothetical protein
MAVERPGGSADREPTVLEWLRSLLRGRPIPIPEPRAGPPPPPSTVPASPEPLGAARAWIKVTPRQLRVPVALLLALIAQRSLEQRPGLWLVTSTSSQALAWGVV